MPASAGAACGAVVIRDGRVLDGRLLQAGDDSVPPVVRLRTARSPDCNDQGEAAQEGSRVRLGQMRGISPGVALRDPSLEPQIVYVDTGYLPVRRRHPLHDTLFGAADVPDFTPAAGCERQRIRGQVVTVRLDSIRVESGKQASELFIDADTRLKAPQREGEPRLDVDARVQIRALRCGRRLVARSISATS
jgi:hypothetical protein